MRELPNNSLADITDFPKLIKLVKVKMNFLKNDGLRKTVKWVLPLLVIGGGLLISNVIKSSRPEIPVITPLKPVATIRGVVAKKISFQPVIKAQGTVKAKQQIDLVPEVAGKIIWVSPSFAEGGLFKAEETLVRIDPRNYKYAVTVAESNVAEATAQFARTRADADIVAKQWEQWVDGIPTDLALRKPQVAEATAKLKAAEANRDRARLDLKRTEISVPFTGRIRSKFVDIGQYVSLGNKLANLYSTDIAEVSLPLTDSELGKVDMSVIYSPEQSTDAELEVRLFANVGGKRRSWMGKVVRTAGTVDLNSRVLSIIVEVENPYQVKEGGAPLLDGLFVEVEIPGKIMQDVFLLPRSALFNQSQVVVVDKNDTLRSRNVEILHSTQQDIIVRGLQEGERINISPLEILIEGSKVQWNLMLEDVQ